MVRQQASIALFTLLVSCANPGEQVAEHANAIMGGELDTAGIYTGVACVPEAPGSSNTPPDHCIERPQCPGRICSPGVPYCILRCRGGFLITPTFAMARRWRHFGNTPTSGPGGEGKGRQEFLFGLRPTEGAGPDVVVQSTEWFEVRDKAGVIRACKHPQGVDMDGDGLLENGEEELRRRAEPSPEDFDTCAFVDSDGECKNRPSLRPITWNKYIESCENLLEPDDDVIFDMALFQMPHRISADVDRSYAAIEALRLATHYPGQAVGSPVDTDFWLQEPRPLPDHVGYGTSEEGGETRRVAYESTYLDPAENNGTQEFFPADGTTISLERMRWNGDESGAGSAKMDYGTPLLLEVDGEDQVVAMGDNLNGNRDQHFDTHLHPAVLPHLLDFLDPDRDGIMRGFLDVVDSTYVDGDGDGLSESRMLPDGTSVATGNDNCPPSSDIGRGAYNRNQQDSDGDGVGDVCDVCPTVADPEQFSCTTSDGSVRGIVCGEEGQDWVYEGSVEAVHLRVPLDSDGNGEFDTCQFCQAEVRAGLDCDGDGIGDPCEPDSNGNGVPDDCDVCPFSSFPAYQNCNHDSELEMVALLGEGEYPIRPDGCDPNPCAETWVETSSELEANGLDRTIRMDRILVDPRVAGEAEMPELLPGETLVAGDSLATGFRFCPCPLAGDDLRSRTECAESYGCQLADIPGYDDDEGASAWLRFSVVADDPAVQIDAHEWNQTYQPPEHLYDPQGTGVWQRDDDFLRWTAAGVSDFGAAGGTSFVPELARGVLWTHTRGPEAASFSQDRRRVTNHYWDGAFEGDFTATPPWPCLSYAGPFLGNHLCPHCAASFPGAFIGFGGDFVNFCERTEQPPLIALPQLPIDLAPVLDPVEAYFQDPWAWVTPAEPPELVEPGHTIMIATDPYAGHAVQSLVLGTSAVEPGVELAFGDGVDHFVLSATRRELFSVDLDGEWLAVHAKRLDTGQEREVYVEQGDDPILGVTYSARSNRLLLLRLDPNDGWVRLIGIDPDTGASSVLRTGPADSSCGTYTMREDVAGGLWVIADSASNEHTIAYVPIDDAGAWSAPARHDVGPVPRAASDVMVDERGLSLPLADGSVRGVRLRDLDDDSIRCF